MSKYQPLSDRLAVQRGGEWRATFAEIEEVLGFLLPKGARAGRAWWAAGPDKPHARAWAGWEPRDLDLAGGAVTFRRASPLPAAARPATDVPDKPRPPPAALVAAGAALALGLGAILLRTLLRRR